MVLGAAVVAAVVVLIVVALVVVVVGAGVVEDIGEEVSGQQAPTYLG